MADELNLQFTMRQVAPAAMAQWRERPPAPIADGGLELVDETRETLVFEGRYEDWPARVVKVVSLGLDRLWGGMGSIWRLSVRFDPDGDHGCRVTIFGRADERTRAALGRLAAERGTVLRAGGVPPTGP